MSKSYITDPDGKHRVMGTKEIIVFFAQRRILQEIETIEEVLKVELKTEGEPLLKKIKELRIACVPKTKRHLYSV